MNGDNYILGCYQGDKGYVGISPMYIYSIFDLSSNFLRVGTLHRIRKMADAIADVRQFLLLGLTNWVSHLPLADLRIIKHKSLNHCQEWYQIHQ